LSEGRTLGRSGIEVNAMSLGCWAIGGLAWLATGPARAFAVSVAQMAVDPDTGWVTLTWLTTAQDVGKSVNPLAVEGQIQG
jgi:CO/xanthine dehydrogenase Mo-binding subunit